MDCRTGTMLDVFERAVQDPCSLDLDEQDELEKFYVYGSDDYETGNLDPRNEEGQDEIRGLNNEQVRDLDQVLGQEQEQEQYQDQGQEQSGSETVTPHTYVAVERGTSFIIPTTSFTNVALDPLEEEDPLVELCGEDEEDEEEQGEEEDKDTSHKDKKSKLTRRRKPSITSSNSSSYLSDVSSIQSATKLRSPAKQQDQKFKNPFKTPSFTASSNYNINYNNVPSNNNINYNNASSPTDQFRLRRTMTDPDFPLRPSVLSRRNTSTIIQQMNNNSRSQSIQSSKPRKPSLKRASNSSMGALNRNNSFQPPQRSNSTSFVPGNAIMEDSPSPQLESPSRPYSRCGSIAIPTHLYSLEKYVSSQLDALATKDYKNEEDIPPTSRGSRKQRSYTVAGLINTFDGGNDKVRGADRPTGNLSRCSSSRKKSYIEMSLENSFA
ncbi:hypothetical protein RNJ44_02646 [Nakaseomyces bracarensis]|uniref:Uncharacterized protein n=1 Tax=Nakaseomyces bracarensis TaxID=273131 RepID=A0ABR4NZV9_9SACH